MPIPHPDDLPDDVRIVPALRCGSRFSCYNRGMNPEELIERLAARHITVVSHWS